MSHPHQVAPSIVQQNTDGLIINCDYDANGLRYVGYAKPGSLDSDSVWQIQRIDYVSGKISTMRFAGNAEFNQAWDNRGAITYT